MLTYDDGPGKDLTPALLELLARHNVHATFFLLGCKVEACATQAADIAGQGHVIGSHSFGHMHAWKSSPYKVMRDIREGLRVCHRIAATHWFRPPYGKITLASLWLTWSTHQKLAWWTIDSTDTWPNPLPVATVVQRVRSEGGGIILMHDHDRQNTGQNDYVLQLTQELIKLARAEGYNIHTLQDLPFTSINGN